ncbi:MAG: MinD/ParA family protein [Deltaproteobacteria bacterium]|jgi:flagellar biosynthesis protein FlhG|nr:MinD/ParA family protein [Deltaproteobacteria bacterium]
MSGSSPDDKSTPPKAPPAPKAAPTKAAPTAQAQPVPKAAPPKAAPAAQAQPVPKAAPPKAAPTAQAQPAPKAAAPAQKPAQASGQKPPAGKPGAKAAGGTTPKLSVSGKPVRVIAVSSGKGGVGKSNITLGLAIALAGLGRKVLLWDADLGLANTDVLLGIRTKATIHDWLKGEKSLSEIIVKGPKGINILPAASGILELNEIGESQKARLIAEFEQWQDELDFLLIDTAAGIGPNVIFFNLVAQEHLIILNNEPTSITDAYALIKALNTKHRQSGFYLLPNMVSGPKDARAVFELMSNVAGQYLGQVSLDLAGYVPYDEAVPASVRRQQPFYILYPDSEASLRIADLARYLIGREPPAFGVGGLVLFLNRLVSMERAVD